LRARKTCFKCDFLSSVQEISAKCHENKCKDEHCAEYQHFTFCLFTVLNELKERLIVVWSDFWHNIIVTAIDQCRKHLQACVRANGHFNTFCEQTLANNLHFSCVFWFKWLLSIVSDFYCVDAWWSI